MKLNFAAAALLTASFGFAGTISFSGTGVSGTVAPGETWTTTYTGSDLIWGIPQFSEGDETWNGSVGMIGLSFTFTGTSFPASGFDQSQTPDCGSGDGLVMCDGSTPWTTVVTGDTVTFTAIGSDVVTPGQNFFVNIPILLVPSSIAPGGATAASVPTVTFNGFWTTVASTTVPEPGSFMLLGAGLAGLGFLARKRSRV